MYIAYIWSYTKGKTAMLSKEGETLADFRKRVYNCYSPTEDWHCQFSEFKEIYE
jgi:hypothetical protein